jgi:hypothetical protein
MIKVYATALAVGVLGLIVVVVGGALAESTGRDDRDPAHRLGHRGRLALGATLGFGMGGMASEFSPLGPSWPVSLLIAVVAATISIIWVRYTSSPTGPE